MREPRAAFSYYGGKQRLATQVVPLLPPHTVYVEPFCGGAALLFAKGRPRTGNNHDYREVLNDTDQRIINFYRVLQDPALRAALSDRLAYTPYAKAEYACARALLEDPATDAVSRAWAWLVQIEMSFSGKLFAGWGRGVFSRNHSEIWATKRRSLAAVAARLDNVFIDCLDAIACIEAWASPQTCFYVDPPYVGTNQGHYSGYTQADFDQLLAALDSCGSSFLLSCYENPSLARYPDWARHEFAARISASGKGAATQEELGERTRTELVYRVDRSAGMRRFSQEATRRLTQRNLF
jgi:DNA adenine methylase